MKRETKMVPFFMIFCALLFLSASSAIHAEIWDRSCESAIGSLSGAQEKVSSAKKDVDSAKFSYEFCHPASYNDYCKSERMNLNYAIDDFNRTIKDFDYTLSSFKNSCLD